MGNPVITRLGLNQFWYKHWYSDKNYSQTIKEDTSLTKFIEFYLNYGVEFKSNPFLHEYWYKKSFRKIRTVDQKLKNLQSYRRYFYTNERLSIEHSYFLRYKTGEYFPMRLWVMRYGTWIFISTHWFKPVKSKKKRSLKSKKKSVGAVSRSSALTNSTQRVALVSLWTSTVSYKNLNYSF